LFVDLLAAILAYLGTVTAIVVAVVMSYDAFIYTPSHSINPQHTVTIAAKAVAAKPSAAKAASVSVSKIVPPSAPVASPPRRATVAKAVRQQIDTAAERRAAYLRRDAAGQKHMRRLARQTRTREWASQQAPGALGYADEPSEGLYNAFPYQ
jgi:hypothetical protein